MPKMIRKAMTYKCHWVRNEKATKLTRKGREDPDVGGGCNTKSALYAARLDQQTRKKVKNSKVPIRWKGTKSKGRKAT